ncbi:ABC transporter ATP-binding protein [Cellulomonas soli]|uniref:ABC transporter ATP-binding protein n=1 Tax=Cellulomonas soli TaxID=931535 RepID=UPI003F830AC5
MATIEMTGVRKTFGSTVALASLDLSVRSGELVCLLGPSGCGKTTALRLLAGFEQADAGQILVDGEDVTRVPPRRRGFSLVFQDYSLFPNLTARDNVAFGLKVRGAGRAEVTETVDRLLATTRLEAHADKYPHQMSGGQKQRVALARAIATQPRLLLLDEPLSALDAQVREHLRDEIRRLQLEVGVTTVLVTHDQGEAMAVADRVAVMRDGVLEQIDTPRTLYREPASPFVAGFVGTVNRLGARRGDDGRWHVLGRPVQAQGDEHEAGAVRAVVRPEQVRVVPLRDVPAAANGGAAAAAAGEQVARVSNVSFLGAVTRVRVEHPAEGPVLADLLGDDAADLVIGDAVELWVRDGAGAVVLQ